jgi:hypothetical protein
MCFAEVSVNGLDNTVSLTRKRRVGEDIEVGETTRKQQKRADDFWD